MVTKWQYKQIWHEKIRHKCMFLTFFLKMQSHSHFQMLAGVCVDFCIVTKRLDLLYGKIFRKFQEAAQVSIFFDVLEPYILSDKLRYISPAVMPVRL